LSKVFLYPTAKEASSSTERKQSLWKNLSQSNIYLIFTNNKEKRFAIAVNAMQLALKNSVI